ncbi:CcdB family protein [Roseibium sp. SCP14]|uniref:CcdB family protein n=1 Tax=Roseibium sp. SCP14 TaxID=3141375 RepID=UPI003335944D
MARNHLHWLEPGHVLVMDVQAGLLENLNTRVVVPLLPKSEAPAPAKFLNPVFTFEGEALVMATQFLSAVSAAQLSDPIGSLDEHYSEITRALDVLFQGV